MKAEVFISYSTEDSKICDDIEYWLKEAGFRVWRDSISIKAGNSWVNSIFHALENADYVVPILSKKALESPWVKKEIETALIRSLSRKKPLSIIPLLIESVEIPIELSSLQAIHCEKNLKLGLELLVHTLNERDSYVNSIDPSIPQHGFASVFQNMSKALLQIFVRDSSLDTVPKSELKNLHKSLIRLQAVVEEISLLSKKDSRNLWEEVRKIMPTPISGAEDVAKSGFRIFHSDNNEKYRINLAARYISILGDVIKSIRTSIIESLAFSNPVQAEALTHLFQSKVSIYKKLQQYKESVQGFSSIISDEDQLLNYIEATRTLEAKLLLQLIDADARELKANERGGVVVFEEIVDNKENILSQVVFLRRSIGTLI